MRVRIGQTVYECEIASVRGNNLRVTTISRFDLPDSVQYKSAHEAEMALNQLLLTGYLDTSDASGS